MTLAVSKWSKLIVDVRVGWKVVPTLLAWFAWHGPSEKKTFANN